MRRTGQHGELAPVGAVRVPDDESAAPIAELDDALDAPVWRRDAVSLSARARRLLATLRPFAIRVFSFWDHRLTRLAIDERVLSVDPSGSYRVD